MNLPAISRAALIGAVFGLLNGCATTAPRPQADLLAAQTLRESSLRAQASWHLNGRVSVSDGQNHGSGRLDWRQDGDRFVLELRAPVTGKSWRLSGEPGAVLLEGDGREAQRGPDAEALLYQALGWRVPVTQLTAWVRALRGASGRARIAFGANGLPAQIVQSQWTVDYRAWFGDLEIPLPRKIFAERTPYQVRLVVQSWSVDD